MSNIINEMFEVFEVSPPENNVEHVAKLTKAASLIQEVYSQLIAVGHSSADSLFTAAERLFMVADHLADSDWSDKMGNKHVNADSIKDNIPEDFIQWNGGECPVNEGDIVDVIFRGEPCDPVSLDTGLRAGWLYWGHYDGNPDGDPEGDIIFYRVTYSVTKK